MKKILFFVIGFMFLASQLKSQDTSAGYSNDASKLVKPKIETEAKAICQKINAEYVGNITTKSAIRDDYSVLVEGTVDYKGKACDSVTATYRAILKVVIDKKAATGKILQVMCFYMNIPTCVEGFPIYYKKEYSVGGEDCK